MSQENNQYGRARIKKSKLALAPSESSLKGSSITKKIDVGDSQTSMELPIKSDQNKNIMEKKERIPERTKPPAYQPMKAKESSSGRPDKMFVKRDNADKGQKPFAQKSSFPKRIRVSIIIPAFNEQDNIRPLVEQFDNVIRKFGSEWEVILVNDGSTDKTAERANEYASRYNWLKVIGYTQNRGITEALSAGFRHARGSIFIFYPADLQYHPNEIPKMIAKIDGGADIVTGWKQGKYNKRFVSLIYNKICRFLFKIKVHDMNSIKAFKKIVIENIPLRRDFHRYLVVLAADSGFNIDEVKVDLLPRHSGKSKFGKSRILEGVLDLFSVKFQISFTKKPLRLFGAWGFILGVAGGAIGLAAIYERFFTSHGSRTLLYPSIIFLFVGLMLFAVGFLAEVIVSLREEIESLKSELRRGRTSK